VEQHPKEKQHLEHLVTKDGGRIEREVHPPLMRPLATCIWATGTCHDRSLGPLMVCARFEFRKTLVLNAPIHHIPIFFGTASRHPFFCWI